ncbi:MAG: quinol:cytochrome C oxidoreductase, partial [Planctomycetota bacterium]
QGHHVTHAPPSKPYLTPSRFVIFAIVYFAIWCLAATFYFRHSVRQDAHRDFRTTQRLEWWSGLTMVAFGLTLTYAAFDFLMSLAPHWYSTIFGVYVFAGCAMSGVATLLLIVLGLRSNLPDARFISIETQRDLGRLMFAFVFFWAYIAFSQYMLLWYANVPETASWLVRRGMSTADGYRNSWGWLSLLLLFGHFVIPFLGIMSRHVKSNARWMVYWCVWLLLMQYADLFWIVMPTWYERFSVRLVDIGVLAIVLGLAGWFVVAMTRYCKLIPVGDPRLIESLQRESMY